MHLIYIDDSRDEAICVFSALLIPAERWRECFELLRSFRRELKRTDGVFVRKELHAWKLVSGRGRISDRVVTKYRRSQIFKDALQLAAQLPEIRIANACSTANDDERAFEYLENRINRTMKEWNSHAILICDEGKEAAYTRLLRRMGVFNPIPSMLGGWPEGTATRNVPTEFILEDPVFKVSQRSYFIQLADFCAYSLLRKEQPVPSKSKYGLDTAFDLLDARHPGFREENAHAESGSHVEPTERRCTGCSAWLPLADFPVNRRMCISGCCCGAGSAPARQCGTSGDGTAIT